MKKSNEILISNLTAEMDRLKWKDHDLAKETKLTRSGIYKILKGQRWPSADNLDRITKAFNRPSGWLLTDHSEIAQNQPTPQEALSVLAKAIQTPQAAPSEVEALRQENARLKAKLAAIEEADRVIDQESHTQIPEKAHKKK